MASRNPSIVTLAATQVGSSSALLHADVNSTGGEDANISFAFGKASDDLSSSSQIISSSESGEISILLTALDENETYYFRARIENSLSSHEAADLYTFTTLNQKVAPLIEIGPASNITASGATLSYDLISYDTDAPEITLFWGPIDHEELAGLWPFSYSLGEVSQIGTGTHTISEMAPGETFITGCGPRPTAIPAGPKMLEKQEPLVSLSSRYYPRLIKRLNLQLFGGMSFPMVENRMRYFSNNL